RRGTLPARGLSRSPPLVGRLHRAARAGARSSAILEHLDTAGPPATCADTMRKSIHRRKRALPLIMTEMIVASWETIARRTLMIAQNTCTSAEYKRMVIEKQRRCSARPIQI